jgi:hypothetical protein
MQLTTVLSSGLKVTFEFAYETDCIQGVVWTDTALAGFFLTPTSTDFSILDGDLPQRDISDAIGILSKTAEEFFNATAKSDSTD